MLTNCQLLTLIPIGCTVAILGMAIYESQQQRRSSVTQPEAMQDLSDRLSAQTKQLEALNAVEPPLLDCDQAPNANDREYRHWVPKISPSVDAYSEGCADGEAAGKAIGRAQAYTAIVDLLCLRAETPGKAAIEAQECRAIAALICSVFPQPSELPDGLDHPTVKQLLSEVVQLRAGMQTRESAIAHAVETFAAWLEERGKRLRSHVLSDAARDWRALNQVEVLKNEPSSK